MRQTSVIFSVSGKKFQRTSYCKIDSVVNAFSRNRFRKIDFKTRFARGLICYYDSYHPKHGICEPLFTNVAYAVHST